MDTLWTYFGHCLDMSKMCPNGVQNVSLFWTMFGHILDTFWTHIAVEFEIQNVSIYLDTFWTL